MLVVLSASDNDEWIGLIRGQTVTPHMIATVLLSRILNHNRRDHAVPFLQQFGIILILLCSRKYKWK